MNAQRRIFLLISLIAAAGIALLVFALLRDKSPQTIVLPQASVTRQVLVAQEDIPAGTPLNESMVHWRDWPADRTGNSFITGRPSDSVKGLIDGTVARSTILKDMPLTGAMLIHTKQSGYMAAALTPGMRAMAIPVSLDRAVAGFIRPDNHVDILFARMTGNQQQVEVLLSDVRILAIDQTAEVLPKSPSAVKALRNVTVEVTPEQAKLLTQAHISGNLSLTLRPLPHNTDSGPIRIIRGGPPPDMSR